MKNVSFILVLIPLLTLGHACGTGVQPEQKQTENLHSEPKPVPEQTEPAPSSAPKPNHFSLDTGRQASQPVSENARTVKPPAPAAAKSRIQPPGPPGYVTRKDAVLQAEPVLKAATIAPLSQYENVYILETIFTDEKGQQSEYPTWYKVERENKQQGWVAGRSINSGGGG